MISIPKAYLKSLDTAHRRAVLAEQALGKVPTKERDKSFGERLSRGFEMIDSSDGVGEADAIASSVNVDEVF